MILEIGFALFLAATARVIRVETRSVAEDQRARVRGRRLPDARVANSRDRGSKDFPIQRCAKCLRLTLSDVSPEQYMGLAGDDWCPAYQYGDCEQY